MAELTQDELDWFEANGWRYYPEDDFGATALYQHDDGIAAEVEVKQSHRDRTWSARRFEATERGYEAVYETRGHATPTAAFVAASIEGWGR